MRKVFKELKIIEIDRSYESKLYEDIKKVEFYSPVYGGYKGNIFKIDIDLMIISGTFKSETFAVSSLGLSDLKEHINFRFRPRYVQPYLLNIIYCSIYASHLNENEEEFYVWFL